MKDNTQENNHETSDNNQIILVNNISRNLTRKHLQEIFNSYGIVKGVYIPKDDETKLQKNYAFVEYENQNEAEKASLFMGGGQIDGLIIRTEILNPKYYNQKQKLKLKLRSRSRDKEINISDKNNGNILHSKNNSSNNNNNDSKQRKRYHRKRSSKSLSSHSSKSKEK